MSVACLAGQAWPHSQSLQPLLDCLIVETVLLTIHPASQIPPCGDHSWFCQRFLPGNLSLHSFPHPTPRDSDFNKLRILNLKQVTLVDESLDGDSKLVLGEARVHGVPPWLIEGLAGEFKLYLWTVFLWEWQAYFFSVHNWDEFMVFMEIRWFSAW